MPDPSIVIQNICAAYDALVSFGPYVAMLIVAAVLFVGILSRHVAMVALILAVVMALVIGMFGTILGALGVTPGCT